MKQWITLAVATAIFASCTKQDLQQETLQQEKAHQAQAQTAALRQAQGGAYISDWEQYSIWSKTDEGNMSKFIMMRKTPEINSGVTNGGLVLSYSKVATTDPVYARFTSPNMMPFYFLPEAERPRPETFYFTDASSDGNLTITYQVPFTKNDLPAMGGGASLGAMQFQYVVLTKAFLDANNLSAETVRNYYTYDQVMNLLNP